VATRSACTVSRTLGMPGRRRVCVRDFRGIHPLSYGTRLRTASARVDRELMAVTRGLCPADNDRYASS
jgi:hypothetical protein